MTFEEAAAEVHRASTELARCHREYALVAQHEKNRRVAAFNESPGDSVSARDRWADTATLDLAIELVKLRGEIAALEVELATARFVIEHHLYGDSDAGR